jgi:imidazolonepropionase-like amidohydrolase
VSRVAALAAAALIPVTGAQAQPRPVAIRGGEVHTVSDGVIPGGVVLVRNGKIAAVGRGVEIPGDAEVVDASGWIVTPGLIDSRSSYGLSSNDTAEEPLMSPARRVLDGFAPPADSPWLKEGVTAAYIAPSPRQLVGGMGAVVKLAGEGHAAIVSEAAGMEVSFAETALGAFRAPTTRQGLIARLRQELIRTGEYLDRREMNPSSTPLDPAWEALARVIRRELPLRVYANTPDDILTAARLGREFELKVVIDSAAGAHRVAHTLSSGGWPVVIGPSILGLGGGGPFELFAHTPENAARCHRAGVSIALSTESTRGRSVVLEAVVAKSHGLPEGAALRAVTLAAAEILGVADRLGSLQAGKDADLVLWKGRPLSTWGEARRVIVDGHTVFERP